MPITEDLKALKDLHVEGGLTDTEFANAKAKVLAPSPQLTRTRPGVLVGLLAVALALAGGFLYQHASQGTAPPVPNMPPPPIQIANEIQNVPANSYKSMRFTVAYTGTVTLAISVVHGNPIDVFVIPADQLATLQAKDWQNLRSFTEFNATKTQTYERTAQVPLGAYYLVLRDTSLGVLSSSASDISIKMNLKP